MGAFRGEMIASAYMQYWMKLRSKQYCKLKEEELDRLLYRTRFGRGYGRVVRNKYRFNVHGSMHRKNILIYIQQDATLHSLFYLETALHVSGGTSIHHQEYKQLYLQHLVFVTPYSGR